MPLSKQTLLITVITSGVIGLILGVFIIRAIVLCCRRSSAPIPPPQPLARHRAQAAENWSSSPIAADIGSGFLPQSPYLSPPAPALASSPSSPSLENATEESTNSDLMSRKPLDGLSPTLPLFHLHSPSSSSFQSENETPILSTLSTSESLSRSGSHSQPRPRSSVSSPARSRPTSFSSTTSRTIPRVAPHSPYSNVQVVLPAPLASSASSTRRQSVTSLNRLSLADAWAPPLVRSESTKSSGPGGSRNSTSSLDSSSRHRIPRRASSSPTSSSRSSAYIVESTVPPPVPRIPSIYGAHPSRDAQSEHQHAQVGSPNPAGQTNSVSSQSNPGVPDIYMTPA